MKFLIVAGVLALLAPALAQTDLQEVQQQVYSVCKAHGVSYIRAHCERFLDRRYFDCIADAEKNAPSPPWAETYMAAADRRCAKLIKPTE